MTSSWRSIRSSVPRGGRRTRLSLEPASRARRETRGLPCPVHRRTSLLPTSPEVGVSLELLAKRLAAAGIEVKRETRSCRISRPRPALRQALERSHIRPTAGRPNSGNSSSWSRRSQPTIKAWLRARGGAVMSHREWVRADFARQGPQTSMERFVSRLRRRRLSAGCDARVPSRSVDAQEARKMAVRWQGISLSAPAGVGRTRDDLRIARHRHSDRGHGQFADWRPDHRPGIRRPDAARFRARGRARIRRFLLRPVTRKAHAGAGRKAISKTRRNGAASNTGRRGPEEIRTLISAKRITSEVQSSGMTGLV